MAARTRVFLDSSALIAAILSHSGAARVVLALAAARIVTIVISDQVQVECMRMFTKKVPGALSVYTEMMERIEPEVVADPSDDQVAAAEAIINSKDAPILAAAIAPSVEYLVSLDRRHSPTAEVARKTGLRMGTPGDFLAWLREKIASA